MKRVSERFYFHPQLCDAKPPQENALFMTGIYLYRVACVVGSF